MAVESDADRSIFLNPDEFGVTLSYEGDEIDGIFDANYFRVELGAPVPAEGARCRLLCRTSDLPAGGSQGDAVTITGGSVPSYLLGAYLVREVEPDGTGMTMLVVERQ